MKINRINSKKLAENRDLLPHNSMCISIEFTQDWFEGFARCNGSVPTITYLCVHALTSAHVIFCNATLYWTFLVKQREILSRWSSLQAPLLFYSLLFFASPECLGSSVSSSTTSNIITAAANKIKHKPKGINVVIVVNKVNRRAPRGRTIKLGGVGLHSKHLGWEREEVRRWNLPGHACSPSGPLKAARQGCGYGGELGLSRGIKFGADLNVSVKL